MEKDLDKINSEAIISSCVCPPLFQRKKSAREFTPGDVLSSVLCLFTNMIEVYGMPMSTY